MSIASRDALKGAGPVAVRLVAAVATASAALSGLLVGAVSAQLAGAALLAILLGGVVVITDAWVTLYVAAFPFQGVSLFGVEAFGFRLSHVFFLVALCVGIGGILLRARPVLPRLVALDFAVVAFVLLSVLSILWSPAPLSRSGVQGAKFLFDLVVYFTFAALVRRHPRTIFRRVTFGYAIAFIYLTALTAYQLFELGFAGLVSRLVLEAAATGSGAINELNLATSAYMGEANRGGIASWEVLGLMLTWGVVSDRWRELRRIERLFWYVALSAAACYVVVSLGRAAWLSLMVGSIVLWWRAGYPVSGRVALRLAAAVAGLSVVLVASGFLAVLVERGRAGLSLADYGVESRFDLWQAVLARFVEHPVFGVGLQGTERLSREMTFGAVAGHPHNVYLLVLAEFGLAGACLFGVLVGRVLWDVWRVGDVLPSETRRLAWGLLAALCCYFVQGLTQHDFADMGIWTLLGLSAGLLRTQLHRAAPNESGA